VARHLITITFSQSGGLSEQYVYIVPYVRLELCWVNRFAASRGSHRMKQRGRYHLVEIDSKEVLSIWPDRPLVSFKSLAEGRIDYGDRECRDRSKAFTLIANGPLLTRSLLPGIPLVEAPVDKIELLAHRGGSSRKTVILVVDAVECCGRPLASARGP
jgi:hypothetical protein